MGLKVVLAICVIVFLFLIGTSGDNQTLQVQNRTLALENEPLENYSEDNLWSMIASLGSSSDSNPSEYNREDSMDGLFDFDWHLKLGDRDLYQLDWKVEYGLNKIFFSLTMNQTVSETKYRKGYDVFALGFSPDGRLENSDFCIIWYDLGHQVHLQDARSDSSNRLKLIEESESFCKFTNPNQLRTGKVKTTGEWEVNHGSLEGYKSKSIEEQDSVKFLFFRPIDTCRSDRYTIDNGTTHVVWFSMRGPILMLDGLDLTKQMEEQVHSLQDHNKLADTGLFEHGMKRVQLITSKAKFSQSSGHAKLHEVRMDRYEIPAQETTYWCKLFKLPHKFESRKYHVTQYEAVIEKDNEHVVHHMELFNCANLTPDQALDLKYLYEGGGWEGECNEQKRPKVTETCKRVIMAWAMGAHSLEYPEQVGQSIGGLGYSPYVVLEVHYNNVGLSKGLVDSSGLKFHYTSKLRPYEAGILEIGLEYTDKTSIPPNLITPIAGQCVSECTRVAMGSAQRRENELNSQSELASSRGGDLEDGIYIFAAQMHTHLAGIASWTEHIREGRILGELQRDNHYSPHFQEIRLLPEPFHVAPGDALVHYCLYDTRSRSNITLGGYATQDEMCVTYLHYFPRLDLEVCKSSVDTNALERYFAYLSQEDGQGTSQSLLELNPNDKNARSVSENYRSIKWSQRRSQELIEFYSTAPLSVQCNRSNGDRYPGYWNGMAPTRLWTQMIGREPQRLSFATGPQLMNYRGREFGRRHAQCTSGKEPR